MENLYIQPHNLNMYQQVNVAPQTNRFVYVKQHFMKTNQPVSTKVLINPNFKPSVHINPNFKATAKTNVYINPNVIKCKLNTPKEPVQNVEQNRLVVSTRTKLIRAPNKSSVIIKTPVQKKRIAMQSRYKIIRKSISSDSIKNNKTQMSIKKLYYIRNKFKIDKRLRLNRNVSSDNVIKTRCKTLNMSLVPKNVIIKHKSNKSQFVSINGILYKKSPNTLKRTNPVSKNNESIINISGLRYKMDAKQKTLKLIPGENKHQKNILKRIHIGGVTFKRSSANVFVKSNFNKTCLLMSSQAKMRSIQTLSNKMKKSNIPCPFYRKFGRCKGKENGTCIRIHNSDQIALCPKFLQGACVDDNCLLSHKVSAKKMPTCKFFLEGLCSKDNCPYLHVKINAKADICIDFLQGFCGRAEKCEKRHQFLCPDFEKKGSCPKKKCPYPHGNVVRKHKFINKVATKSSNKLKTNRNENKNVGKNLNDNDPTEKNVRYYKDIENSDNQVILMKNNEEVDTDISDCEIAKRPKLGDLPSFIPLFSNS